MTRFENVDFTDTDVLLDGNEYIHCVFTRCRLIYGGEGEVGLMYCHFYDFRFVFQGHAASTVKFLSALYKGGLTELVENTFKNIRGDSTPPGDHGFDLGS